VAAGTYSLTAKATDNQGLSATSAAVSVTVKASVSNNIVAYGSDWKYLDNGTDQGTRWRATAYSDGTWKAGNAILGYGNGNETTVVGFGPDASKKYITTYFRKTISISDTTQFSGYVLSIKRDDGAVVYINGVEVFRTNMPSADINYLTLAAASGSAGTAITGTLPLSALRQGTNVIAVEIHQNNASSSDISFDFELTATYKNLLNQTSSSRFIRVESAVITATPQDMFLIEAFPNPSTSYFNLKVQSPDNEPILMRLLDLSGRILEAKTGIQANSTIQIGSQLSRGKYIVEVIQGRRRTVRKITKM
jgi:hypothetical protein